jgi:hypothetical protein
MGCWARADHVPINPTIHKSTNPSLLTFGGWRGLRARRFFAVVAVPSRRIRAVPVAGRCLRVRRSLAAPGDSSRRIRVGAGEMPGLPMKQFVSAVLRSLPRIPGGSDEMSVRPVKRFCVAVLGPLPRIRVVRGFCGLPEVHRRRHRRSVVGCGVTQIPFWETASGFVTNYGLRRPWCAVVSLS